jgi:hypothetical protein
MAIFWGVYFMSMEDERAVKERVLFEYAETNKTLAALRERAHQLGTEFIGLGDMVKSEVKIKNIALESYQPLLSKATLDKIVELQSDLSRAEDESARLTARMRELGYENLISR